MTNNSLSPFIEQSEADRRLALCHVCENYIKLTGQCSLCYCFMGAKVRFRIAKCPAGKW